MEGKGEMTKTLIAMVGLSNSGKTTQAWAMWRELAYSQAVVVNRDTIRRALYDERYIAEREEEVNAIEEIMVTAHFLYGYNIVIVDACHHKREYRKRWQKIAEENGWEIRFRIVNTPIEECLRRACEKGDDYIIPVIEKQAGEADFWEEL
jgi:predicted kinase